MQERYDFWIKILKFPDDSPLNEEQSSHLRKLIYEFAEIISIGDTDLGKTDLAEHSIDTRDHAPISCKPYKVEFQKKKIIEQEVEKMLRMGVIEYNTRKVEWASPALVVPKSDGSMRFCVDYRALNKLVHKDSFPLPRILDIIPMMAKNRYFATLDLASGYWQIPMSDLFNSKDKTTFTTHMGTFRFLRMPFGEQNCPMTFQRAMQRCLGTILNEGAYLYLDDILVVGKDFDEFLSNMKSVLEKTQGMQPKIEAQKMQFCKKIN